MLGVYDQLYDIVSNEMTKNGKRMPCTKRAFLYAAEMETGRCDMSQMQDMNNLEFMESAYLSMFGRLPDGGARREFSLNEEKTPKQYQSELVCSLIGSGEAIIKNAIVINNESVKIERKMDIVYQPILGSEEEDIREYMPLGFKDKLYKIYMRTPVKFRKVVRKIVRRGE